MKADDEGFLYPFVNQLLCIKCGLCKTVCPINNKIDLSKSANANGQDFPFAYAVKHKDSGVRMCSSSGGAYTAISDYVMNNGLKILHLDSHSNDIFDHNYIDTIDVVCYGAAFSNDFSVHHISATTATERDLFRGSKYVQSELGFTFTKIKQNLIDGKTVLFTGTPCQTAGLRKFLEVSKFNTTNLILNDIICHGTPSPKLWNDYKKLLITNYKSKLKMFSFRDKEIGWKDYPIRAVFENGTIKKDTSDLRIFIKLFFTHLALRPSCYHCKFANLNRPSDITMGDFWGIEKCLPEFGDEKGVSLVLVNSLKGQAVFEQIKDSLYCKQCNTIDCAKYQHNLNQPTPRPANRDAFWQDYRKMGFNYIIKKYAGFGIAGRMKSFTVKELRRFGLLKFVIKVLRRWKRLRIIYLLMAYHF